MKRLCFLMTAAFAGAVLASCGNASSGYSLDFETDIPKGYEKMSVSDGLAMREGIQSEIEAKTDADLKGKSFVTKQSWVQDMETDDAENINYTGIYEYGSGNISGSFSYVNKKEGYSYNYDLYVKCTHSASEKAEIADESTFDAVFNIECTDYPYAVGSKYDKASGAKILITEPVSMKGTFAYTGINGTYNSLTEDLGCTEADEILSKEAAENTACTLFENGDSYMEYYKNEKNGFICRIFSMENSETVLTSASFYENGLLMKTEYTGYGVTYVATYSYVKKSAAKLSIPEKLTMQVGVFMPSDFLNVEHSSKLDYYPVKAMIDASRTETAE